jgi:hypothetical protein
MRELAEVHLSFHDSRRDAPRGGEWLLPLIIYKSTAKIKC